MGEENRGEGCSIFLRKERRHSDEQGKVVMKTRVRLTFTNQALTACIFVLQVRRQMEDYVVFSNTLAAVNAILCFWTNSPLH